MRKMLKQMSQMLPSNSNNQQDWEHIDQGFHFPLMKSVVLVQTQSSLNWDR